MLLKNKSIIITGAGKGIGKSIAMLAGKNGAKVGLIGRSNSIKKTNKELISMGIDSIFSI